MPKAPSRRSRTGPQARRPAPSPWTPATPAAQVLLPFPPPNTLGRSPPHSDQTLSPKKQYRRDAATAQGLSRSPGNLRVRAWLLIHGMFNTVPDFAQTISAIKGFPNLIDERYGPADGNSRYHGTWPGDATVRDAGHHRGRGRHQQPAGALRRTHLFYVVESE